jgi:hypothetical protein
VPAVPLDVLHQRPVLLLRPRALLHAGVVAAARRPPHLDLVRLLVVVDGRWRSGAALSKLEEIAGQDR